jgi:hypothetical protein
MAQGVTCRCYIFSKPTDLVQRGTEAVTYLLRVVLRRVYIREKASNNNMVLCMSLCSVGWRSCICMWQRGSLCCRKEDPVVDDYHDGDITNAGITMAHHSHVEMAALRAY